MNTGWYVKRHGGIRLSFVPFLLFITIVVVDYIQRLSIIVTRQLRLFPERLVVFLALEHLFRHLCRNADVMGLGLVIRVFSASGFVADVWVGGAGGCGPGVGRIDRYRVV
jgi:hypothetical protein